MRYLLRLLSIFFLVPVFSFAQANFQPGVVVNLKGDTLRGFIDYQAWDSNPDVISFKSAISDRDKKAFSINDISFFNIDGLAAYKKFTCTVSMDGTNTTRLAEGRDTSFKTETVFLKVLQQGRNLALYSYSDAEKVRFYIGEAPGFTPTELVYRVYFDLNSKTGRTINEVTYQKQLFALANKYNSLSDELTEKLENSNYEKGELLDIVSRINNISQHDFDKKYAEHSKFSWYISAALNKSTTSSSPTSSYSMDGGITASSYLPAVAVGIDLIPDPKGGRIELRGDISVNPTHFNALYKLKVSPYVGAKASYDQLAIALTPQIAYNFYNSPDFKFYVGCGLSITHFSYSNPYFQSQNTSAPSQGFPAESFIFNDLDEAFLFKAGFRIHKNWEIYFNYFTNTVAAKDGYFGLNNENKQLGISYFFSK